MNGMRRRPREAGGLVLTVLLLLVVVAALAFGLNRASGMDAQAVSADYDKRNAAYLAKAAIAAAKWMNQASLCTSAGFSGLAFGGGTLTGTIAKPGGKLIAVTGNATTASGYTATLSVNNLPVVDFSKSETKDLGGGVLDTYVAPNLASMSADTSLVLASGQSNVLLFWPMTDIPGDSDVLSAQLIMTQNGGSGTARTIAVHRMTTGWDASATWTRARAGVAWNGGDYSTPILASLDVKGGGPYTWDVTGLVDGWSSGRLANNGMLLRLPNAGQSATFFSREAANSGVRPILRVTFAKSC
jgi:Tfp pilus assembly protein PilX